MEKSGPAGQFKLNFWGWDEPVLTRAVARLAAQWSGGALDLRHMLLIVPTAETVRRLREALAVEAGRRGGAASVPHLWHAGLTFQPRGGGRPLATPLQERAVWAQVLQEAPLEEMRALFPTLPEAADRGANWAAAVAETIGGLRKTLGAGGLTLEDAAGPLAALDDPQRWQQLARLERHFQEALERHGLRDGEAAKRAAAESPVLPEGVTQVVVLAVADAPPLFATWLRQVARQAEVEVWVQAPAGERRRFDETGMPLASAWGDDARLDCPLEHDRMHRVSGAEDQARLVVSLLGSLAAHGPVALGVCDPELNSVLEGTLTAEGVRVYNPAGRTARQHAVVQVMKAGWTAARSAFWRDWLPFLRMEDVCQALCRQTGLKVSDFHELLDEVDIQHIPPTIDDARVLVRADEKLAALVPVLEAAVRHAEDWAEITCEGAVRRFLLWLYGEREFDSSLEHHKHHGALFGEALRLAAEVDASRPATSPALDWTGLALDALEQGQVADLRGEADLVLYGWLELLWEPAPGLVITGFNDEHVPGTVKPDPFLPDRARAALGLPCQATRRARDAYFLKAMAAQRQRGRSLHAVLGRMTADGDALRPSRLLLDASDASLPGRVKHLFPAEEEVKAAPRPPRTQPFLLTPPRRPWARKTLSPTALRRYLACPFRFYLADVLRMEGVETGIRELSPASMGDLLHKVLKDFAEDVPLTESMDAGQIRDGLAVALKKRVQEVFGPAPLFSVTLQVESLLQRLGAFAEVQAGLRREGWRIFRAEEVIDPGWGLTLHGVPLTGKVDRIDRHESDGRLRVIDYKTSVSPPEKAHWGRVTEEDLKDPDRAWMCFEDAEGTDRRWLDLQLPLYREAVARQFGAGAPVEVAYFLIPVAVSKVGVKAWEALDDATAEAAMACATEAARRIKEGVFWPPAQDLKFDDFEAYFHGDVMKAVAPPRQWLEAHANEGGLGA